MDDIEESWLRSSSSYTRGPGTDMSRDWLVPAGNRTRASALEPSTLEKEPCRHANSLLIALRNIYVWARDNIILKFYYFFLMDVVPAQQKCPINIPSSCSFLHYLTASGNRSDTGWLIDWTLTNLSQYFLHSFSDSNNGSVPIGESPEPVFLKCLWGPGIAQELIPPAYVAWRAGTITLFLLGS